MERPVSFSAEDIRDEKVRCATNAVGGVLMRVTGQGVAGDPAHQVRGHAFGAIRCGEREAGLSGRRQCAEELCVPHVRGDGAVDQEPPVGRGAVYPESGKR